MRDKWLRIALIGALLLLALPASSLAQESQGTTISESTDGIEQEGKTGWHPLLTAAANLAVAHNDNVPGNSPGLSLQFGYIIFGAVDYLNPTSEHEWDTQLFWQLGFARTPAIDLLLKSVDTIDFKTTYLYHIPNISWFGPFAQFRLTAPMLSAAEGYGDDTNVVRLDVGEDVNDLIVAVTGEIDPARVQVVPKDTAIDTTGAFAPLTLRETVGLFAIPLDKEWMKIDIRLGFAAWETFIRDGEDYMVDETLELENTAGDQIEYLVLRQMQDSIQAGPELGIIFQGLVAEMLTYKLSALWMQPVVKSDVVTDKDGWELFNQEYEILLGVKLWKYFSLDYIFKAYNQPLVVEGWQIQNNLLISAKFDIIGPKPAPAADDCVCEETPIVTAEEVTGEAEEAAEPQAAESGDESAAAEPAETEAVPETAPAEE